MLKAEIKRIEKENARLKEINEFGGGIRFFRREPSEVRKEERMKFIALKTSNGSIKGKIALYCKVLKVSQQGFYYYLESLCKPWK